MPVFYKAVFSGSYQGQAIVNVLYYGSDGGVGFSAWSPTEAAQLGSELELLVVPEYLPSLPSTYTLAEIVVSAVDERGVTVSDYEVSVPINEPGGSAVNSEGQAQVAIIAFQTTKAPEGDRNVKRSYLAYGPLHDSSQASDGALESAYAAGLADLLIILFTNLSSLTGDFVPMRVGRTVAPNPVALGKVSGITLRPYASFRKSRKRRPTGA